MVLPQFNLHPHAQKPALSPRAVRHAFTLIEAMILMVVLSIISLGVGIGLQSAANVPEKNDRALAVSAELNSEMDYWRSLAFGPSPWPTTLPSTVTDTVTIKVGGQSITYSRTTTIQTWDPNNLTSDASPQVDFVRVFITINGQSYWCFLTKPI